MKEKIIYFLLTFILTLFIIDMPEFILLFISSNSQAVVETQWQYIIIPNLAVYLLLLSFSNFFETKMYKLAVTILLILTIPFNVVISGIYLFNDIYTNNIVTNMAVEHKNILNIILNFKMLLLIVLFIIPFIILWKIKPVKISNKYISFGTALLSFTMIVATFLVSSISNSVPVINNIKTYIKVSNDKKYYNAVKEQYSKLHKKIEKNSVSHVEESSISQVYVLAVGGCHSKNHFSLYGYPRNTNPLLNELNDKLFLFKNVYTADEDRYKSLSHMITFNYNDESNGLINIIDLFKSAGFKTYWLSNHYIYERENSYNNIVGSSADEYVFTDSGYGYFNKVQNDESLISYYEKILSSSEKKKFIVVHLSGSCDSFEENYNEEYNYFYNKYADEKEKIINDYDNTIVKADYILNRLIEGLEINDSESYMLFVADTGAEILTQNSVEEIPFILWLSEEYKKTHMETASTAKENLSKYYKADSLPESIINLSHITYKYADESSSIFSKKYSKTK